MRMIVIDVSPALSYSFILFYSCCQCSHPHIWRHIRDKDYGNSADFRKASWLVALVYTVSKNAEEGIYTDATVFTLIPVELLGEIFQSLAVEYLMAPSDAEVPN